MRPLSIWLLSTALAASPPAPAAELPDELKRLEREGRVTYTDYDPAREQRAYPARADFHFDLDRKYDFRYRITPSRGARPRRVTVELTITRVDVQIRHTISMPRGWDPTDPALRPLIAHEYDHVAISSDPRARHLLERLLARPITAEFVLEQGGEAAIRERVEQIHTENLKGILDSVVAFVDRHNEQLDALTGHGARPLPDRASYFESLYAPETLRRAGFPDDLLADDLPARPGTAAPPALR